MPRKKRTAPKKPSIAKLEANLAKTILQYMGGKRYKPMEQAELITKLSIPEQLQETCRKLFTHLIQSGEIIVQKNKLTIPMPEEELVAGTLRVHPKGFGFLIPDDKVKYPQDIFIPKHLIDNAVDGDAVEVAINHEAVSEKGPEGKVVNILTRARQHLAGTIRTINENGQILAYVPLLGISKPVVVHPAAGKTLEVGDRVILKVLEWGSEKELTSAEVSQFIGDISNPACDIPAAIQEFDIRNTFPSAAIEQAKSYGNKVIAKEQKKRVDLTKNECFTIDPDTARDFDDALTLTKDRKGNYHLEVHIADVAHYVKPKTPLDQEAYLRSNSTYLPGTCIPMLPEELSNELCSLKPDVVRLTVSVLMDFDKTGTMTHHEIVRSYIKSQKRFTYFEAKEVLDGTKKSPHEKTLKRMVELCLLLKQKRYERGSIDFSLPEIVLIIDEKGNPTGVKKIEYDITHQLVEEFMLKANETVALELTKREKTPIYRVHEEPQEENFEDFLQYARTLGLAVPIKPTAQDLQALFEQAKKTPFIQQLSVAFIRSLKLAFYSPDNVGHFGLALEHYCHFTSPIRRYSDLIVQRLLFDEEVDPAGLKSVAQQCSDQERVSFRTEMSVKNLKKLRLLDRHLKEDPDREHKAIITKIKPFGLYFELTELMLEGFLHISELDNDYFIYDEKRNMLVGRSSGRKYRIGEEIKVKLTMVDLIVQESKWALATDNVRKPRSRRR